MMQTQLYVSSPIASVDRLDDRLDDIVAVMQQLRPQYDSPSLKKQIRQQQESGYQIAYVTDDDRVVCVAGFIVGDSIVREEGRLG